MELIIHILMLFIVILETLANRNIQPDSRSFCSRHLAVCYSPVKDTDC